MDSTPFSSSMEPPNDASSTAAPADADDAWLNTRPKLRDDLSFVPRSVAGRPGYVVEDPLRGRFLRFGMREYAFAAACNGSATIAEAMELASRCNQGAKLDKDDAWALIQWMSSEQLLENTSADSRRLLEIAAQHDARKQPLWKNPICIRLPILHPDRLVARLTPYFGWLVSPMAVWLTLLATLVSGIAILCQLDDFTRSLQGVFTPRGQLELLAMWTMLKVVHELAHGLACKRYGGEVREAGIILLLFLPLAYVDVTSSWRIRSRWKRIHIGGAGMLVELAIASLGTLVWCCTSTGGVHQAAANVVLMASMTTILFNANPLMRFDGYYMLTDCLRLPNLYGLGTLWTRYVLRRYVCGVPATPPILSGRLGVLVRVYAVASAVWRLFVYMGIIVAAGLMWQGAGLLLSILAVFSWFAKPFYKAIKYAFVGDGGVQPQRARVISWAAGVGMLVAACWTVIPWPGAAPAAALVRFAPTTIVRADAEAFVDELFVESGQWVRQGEPLLVLRNDELVFDIARLRAEVQRSRISSRSLRKQRKLAALDAEERKLNSLQRQLAELEDTFSKLTIKAPMDGIVVSPRVEKLIDSYVKVGQELLILGDPRRKELQVTIPQDELDQISEASGKSVAVLTSSGISITGSVTRINPRASEEISAPALAATHGGPLAVAQHTTPSGDGGSRSQQLRLLAPHFDVTAALSSEESSKLLSGQTASVYYGGPRPTLGVKAWKALQDWFAARTGNS